MSITSGIPNLTRTLQWSAELKESLKDELYAQGFVRWLTDFPDGDTFKIPSIGDATVRDYVEDTPIVYDSLQTGNFDFSINQYKQSGIYITKKAQQDLFYANQLEASFVPKQARALAEVVETDILALASAQVAAGGPLQQTGVANAINGVAHRFAATGTLPLVGVFTIADFAKAAFALKKANVPDQALIAIVDPSVEYLINTLSNLIAVNGGGAGAPMWGDLLQNGIGAGFRFVRNIYGFDVYTTNYLPQSGIGGTLGAEFGVTTSVANIFMSAASPEIVPFIGAWRQDPEVEAEANKDLQRVEYLTTARYGLKLYRPENLVTVISNVTV